LVTRVKALVDASDITALRDVEELASQASSDA
jgi:hypothetical protein